MKAKFLLVWDNDQPVKTPEDQIIGIDLKEFAKQVIENISDIEVNIPSVGFMDRLRGNLPGSVRVDPQDIKKIIESAISKVISDFQSVSIRADLK